MLRVLSLLLPLLTLTAVHAASDTGLLLQSYPQRLSDRYTARDGLPPGRIVGIKLTSEGVRAEGTSGAAVLQNGIWKAATSPESRPRIDGAQPVLSHSKGPDGREWVVTDAGVFYEEKPGGALLPLSFPRSYLTNQRAVNTDAEFTSVAVDANGTVWLGSSVGIFATDGKSFWNPLDRSDGLPYENVTCLGLGPDASLWAGTTEGVCRYSGGRWQYYWGPRWLPHNRVNALVVDRDGSAWVATDGGVAHLYDRSITLAEKARRYQEITDRRHNRRGFVTGGRLKKPGDPEGGIVYEASDNDGLWTAVYVGAQAFRWAATHDPAAREAGRKSMRAMLDLVKYSGVPGFPARAIIRRGEEVDGYDPEETVRVPGEKEKIWYASPVDPQVLCKGDTSSDELDGHYFAWSVYYDLAADEDEKKAIRATVQAVTDNLLEHDLTLVGHTRRKTRWGVYSPKYINDDPTWWEERGLNSLSILSYLKIADHICGLPRYAAKYRELIREHHYLLNTVSLKVGEPWHQVNHSDDQMAFMMYYALLKLERDPATRLVLLQSLERSWQIERPEASPFFNFVYAAATGRPADLEASVATLQEWPWELIEWQVRGSQRHDVTMRSWSGEGSTRAQADRVLPASERRLMRWNGNPYHCDGGSPDGRTEEDGSAWLLPYWMGRYHGYLKEGSQR